MTVTEALKIVQKATSEQAPFRTFLACGFTPLHLQLFLQAHLQERLSGRRVEIETGLFGDLAGSIERLETPNLHAVACVIEWPDLDPRFSYREAGDWTLAAVRDMVSHAGEVLHRLASALNAIPAGVRVAVSLPTLPIPPLFHTAGWEMSGAELALNGILTAFAAKIAERKGTVIVNERRLNEESLSSQRLDLKSDLATGLPYTIPHAATVGDILSRLLAPAAPKKGIITDLDDTLWSGLVGEVGPDGVSWDLAHRQQSHGLYQKLLSSLADAGILVGIASKNDAGTVKKALERDDLFLRKDRVFPVEVHWEAKSGSVDRILRTWNVSADSVIFVDDSPMELAEVAAVHPGLTCLHFPKEDSRAVGALLRSLRDLCGKEQVSEDDALRLESIRRGHDFQRAAGGGSASEQFLAQANAVLKFDFNSGFEDTRVLELVNKTNQFNINGIRYTEADWKQELSRERSVLAVVSYEDRFGPLGKISVLAGRRRDSVLFLDTWVLSCRAFARRIEHACLRILFNRFGVERIAIRFAPTPKNGPSQDFFASLFDGEKPAGPFEISRARFEEKCPALYHRVISSAESESKETADVA